MKAYLCAFVNWEQNDWAWLLPIAEFVYTNSENANTGHIPFDLNFGYHPCVSFEDKCDTRFRSFQLKDRP